MVKIYNALNICEKVDEHFTRDGFILYALLAGGDYDKVCSLISITTAALLILSPGLEKLWRGYCLGCS